MRLGFISPSPVHCSGRSARPRSWAVRPCRSLSRIPRGWKWRPGGPRGYPGFLPGPKAGEPGALVVHLSAISPTWPRADPALYARSTERLWQELELARALQADYLVVHPGHVPLGEAGFAQVARALALAVSQARRPPGAPGNNTAGQGQELGWRITHLERIITLSRVPLGLCLDTAHAHAAGYDLSLPAGAARLLADLARGRDWTRSRSSTSMTPGQLQFRQDRHWHLGQAPSGGRGCGTCFPHPGSNPKPPSWRPRNRTRPMCGTISWWPGAWCPDRCSCRRGKTCPESPGRVGQAL